MKKYVLWPLLAAAGGAGAFLLRLLQRSTGFESDTGLPVPGNLYAVLLVIWFVVLAAVCLLAARAGCVVRVFCGLPLVLKGECKL